MFLFRKMAYNCKQATLLSLKKDEGKISLLERCKLFYHLRFCDPCHRFIHQSHLIDKAGGKMDDKIFNSPPYTLSEESKENIQKQIDSLNQ